ncbi:hypothetical protein [Candidatus Viridilinea mediisalina]|uniref:Uncharacterized protein n=1 Tax=Candidatus Viridilinea mediisalina TaxID=2024553 RepID=A0A2A6RKU7_9CHLR|nr:hypothetical protein [Candidatus Viridilinea mediisalina]PDW03516.1 hypothetical protein CJ255_08520 [Candidatus Viridilinea mediisalina]
MSTTPRRWPNEVENEREGAMRFADEATHILQRAQTTLDGARAKVGANQNLALVLITDTERYLSDALARTERVRRFIAVAKGKPINGRWPQVATRQRDEAEEYLERAINSLDEAEASIRPLRDKIAKNPALCEAIIADLALLLSRAITRIERVVRLLTEGGLGRA